MSYIKLDRALKDWRFSHKPNYVALWVRILLEANYKPSKFEDEVLNEGEFVTSIGYLAKKTGLTPQTVRTIIKHLEGEELTIKSTNKFSVISIVNWAKYQGCDDETNKQTNKQLTNDQQTTNNRIRNKEYKKLRNIYNNDHLPVYDPSQNPIMDENEAQELLTLMGKA